MNERNRFFFSLLLSGFALAETLPAQPLSGMFEFHGSARARLESTEGSDFSATPADAYVLSRVRLDVGFRPWKWLRANTEVQDSRVLFYRTVPSSSVSNPFDLHVAFLEVGDLEKGTNLVRVGRQEMTLGSGRLLASLEWSNTGRAYDAARGTVGFMGGKVDVAAGSVILTDPKRFDRHKPGEHFYAAFSSFNKLIPGTQLEPYFIARTILNVKGKDGKLGNADTLAYGFRAIGTLDGGVDYSFEGIREGGSYADDAIGAWASASTVGWKVRRAPWKLRVSGDFINASGDSGVADHKHQNFDNMYGFNQPMNSYTGQFGWKNLREARFGTDMSPRKNLKVLVDFRDYWLATVQDGLYNSSGTRTVFNSKATSSHVGESIEAQAVWSISKDLNVGVGVANLFAGEYLQQSKKTSGFLYPFLYVSRKF